MHEADIKIKTNVDDKTPSLQNYRTLLSRLILKDTKCNWQRLYDDHISTYRDSFEENHFQRKRAGLILSKETFQNVIHNDMYKTTWHKAKMNCMPNWSQISCKEYQIMFVAKPCKKLWYIATKYVHSSTCHLYSQMQSRVIESE